MSLNSLVHSYSFAKCGGDSSCIPSNVSVEWLIYHPHIFLWADKIYISKDGYESLNHRFVDDRIKQESISMVLDEFKKEKVIDLFDPEQLCRPALQYAVWNHVDDDQKRWGSQITETVPGTEKVDLANISIGNTKACPTVLASIYFSLAFSQKLDSGCLFDRHILNICTQRFKEIKENILIDPFTNVFGMVVPEVHVLGEYAVHKICNTCIKEEKCKSDCLEQTEILIGKIKDFRIRDEMEQTKKAIIKAIYLARNKNQNDPKIMLGELNSEIDECKRRMLNTFPKISRWVQITAMVSVPLVYLGTSYNESIISTLPSIGATGLLTKIGGAGLAASTVIDRSLSYLQNKYQWVNFVDELKQFKIR